MTMRACHGCGRYWERILMEPIQSDESEAFRWLCPDCYDEYLAELTSGYS